MIGEAQCQQYCISAKKIGCGIAIRLNSREPCLISVAQAGVRVRKSRSGFFGAILYNEKNVYLAAKTGLALDRQFPVNLVPVQIKNPVLRAFANAAWHCPTAVTVARVLNEALSTKSADEANAKRIEAIIGTVVPAYGEIIEKWPLVIFPTSRLPLSKDEMKTALRLAWRIRKEPHLREFVELAYVHLCQFRDDIAAPIDPTLRKGATPQEATAILDPFLSIADKVETERAQLGDEFREYKAFMQAQGR
jgi:hypothetical protein